MSEMSLWRKLYFAAQAFGAIVIGFWFPEMGLINVVIILYLIALSAVAAVETSKSSEGYVAEGFQLVLMVFGLLAQVNVLSNPIPLILFGIFLSRGLYCLSEIWDKGE